MKHTILYSSCLDKGTRHDLTRSGLLVRIAIATTKADHTEDYPKRKKGGGAQKSPKGNMLKVGIPVEGGRAG